MIPHLADICSQHLHYMQWADEVVLNAVAAHAPGEIATLQHIYLGEKIWLARVQGDTTVRIVDYTPPADIAQLRELWPAMHAQWLAVAASAKDWDAAVAYRLMSGVQGSSPLWQVVLHLANHGSYHRGQVSAKLRAAGFTPPATDLILYYRNHA